MLRGFLFLGEQTVLQAVPPGFAFSPNSNNKKAKDSGGGTPDPQDGVQFPAVSCFYMCCYTTSLGLVVVGKRLWQ